MAPLPKPPGQRRRTNAGPSTRTLPAEGRRGKPPALPARKPPWSKETREWWARIWRSPSAALYALRHTFATEALAAGVSTFELARLMGTGVPMIDRTYGHLASDSHDAILARLDARAARSGVDVVSDAGSGDGR